MVGYWDGLFLGSPMPPKKGQPQNSLTAGPTWWFAARHNGRGIEILLRMRHLRSCNLHVHPLGSIHQGIISSVNAVAATGPYGAGWAEFWYQVPCHAPVCWLTHWKAVQNVSRLEHWIPSTCEQLPRHTEIFGCRWRPSYTHDFPALIQITRCWPNTVGPWGWKQLASWTISIHQHEVQKLVQLFNPSVPHQPTLFLGVYYFR